MDKACINSVTFMYLLMLFLNSHGVSILHQGSALCMHVLVYLNFYYVSSSVSWVCYPKLLIISLFAER